MSFAGLVGQHGLESRTQYRDDGLHDLAVISVAEYESMQETLDILSDDETLSDLRQSRDDFAAGDTFDAGQIRAELEERRR
jgi:antitoxin YefM